MTRLPGQIDGLPVLTVSRTRCDELHGSAEACSYRVAWRINPHMKPGAADPLRAAAQHRALVEELRRAGAIVLELPFVHGAFDSVFAKDNALLVHTPRGAVALLSNFAGHERRAEQQARRKSLIDLGLHVVDSPSKPLEGGDIVRFTSGATLLGHGFRSSAASAADLERFLDAPVLPLELVDPWLYHLDTALAALSDGTVVCCREAFTPDSLRALKRHEDVTELLFVPRDEALRFALNFVQVGDTVITGTDAPFTAQLLSARGLRVRKVALSEFQLAGGSAACLVGRLYGDPRLARSETTAMRSTSA